MRQNRDGSEAFSAGACVSTAEASVSASVLFYPRLALRTASEFLVLSFCPLRLLALASCSALGVAPCRSASLESRLPFRLRVCHPPSLSPSANFAILPLGPKLKDRKRGGGPRTDRPHPPRPAGPWAPSPSRLHPASPARSHLVSLARAAAAAAIYACRGWSRSFKQRFPGARRGAARSLLAPVAANHTPLSPSPAQPLWSYCAALGLGSQGQTFRGSGGRGRG